MNRFIRRTVLLATAVVLFASNAWAAPNDLFLWRMCQRDKDNGDPAFGFCLPDRANPSLMLADNAKFGRFARQFAAVLAPKFHAPAETLGWSGWNLGLEYTLNKIPGGEQWDDALQGVERFKTEPEYSTTSKDGSAPTILQTAQFHARKGLPFSTELGFIISYLISSEMYLAGVEGKVAFVEGFTYVPDMALRMTYEHLFGAPDMDMDILNWDLSISKNFGLGGVVQLAPYTGYSLVYSIAAPHVVNPSFDAENNDRLLLLDKQSFAIHRWFIGVRLIGAYVCFTPEVTVTSENVYNFSFNLGADF
ncbi:MAG: hypothetical protein C4523_11515 [Myxococcales bacterium]|nr:MAG: hypothetical protein C4523_11515 [Myxococcales bacterium]